MKKVLAVVFAVLCFGALAAGVMAGVNKLGNSLEEAKVEETSPAAEENEVADTTVAQAPQAEVLPTAAKTTGNGNSVQKAETVTGGTVMIDVSAVVEEAMPEIVAITNTTVIRQQGYANFYDYFYGRGSEQEYTTTASGSGVIIDEDNGELLIVTNRHVVENADELAVTFIDGESVEAKLKGVSGDVDLAVIAVSLDDIESDTRKAIKVAKLHTEDDLKAGQGVIAIGNALGYGQSVTVGVISALERDLQVSQDEYYEDLIQTDAAINPGNSGGALLNSQGELIGINVAKLATTEVEGVGFSIPIYRVADVIENLSEAKTKVAIDEENQGRLGIYMNTITESQSKALNIPAGVIIVGFSDEDMEGYEGYEKEYSPAKEAGLQKNDIITSFDGQDVTDANSLAELVQYYEAGTDVKITVQRINNGEYEEKEFTVKLAKKTVTETEETSEQEDKAKESEKDKDSKPEEKKENKDKKDDTENNTEDGSQSQEDMDIYEFFKKYLEQYQ